MTLIAAGISLILTVMFAGGIAQVGDAATADARAQLVADATALAAVAELGPGGSGLPETFARRYAEMNGGDVVTCVCRTGGRAVQVTIEVQGASATARAEIDPSLIFPANLVGSLEGLAPEMATAVTSLVSAGDGNVRVVSGYRSSEEQQRLWAAALATYGDPERADDWVARPGGSMHERGLAVDLGGDLLLAGRLVRSLHLPLAQPLPNEPWHFELVGARS
jgi:hypothetical protein